MSETENTTVKKSARTPRANQTRAGQARRQPWRPPSVLDAPPHQKDSNTDGLDLKLWVLMIVRTYLLG